MCQFWEGGTRYPALKRVRGRDCFPSFCPSRTFSHRLQSHRRGCHPPFRGWGVVLASPFLPSDTISGCQTFPLLHKIIASTLASHIPRGHNENQGPYGGCIQSKIGLQILPFSLKKSAEKNALIWCKNFASKLL